MSQMTKTRAPIRSAAAIALTAAVGVGAFAATSGNTSITANAESRPSGVQTAYGVAPISFADLAAKVKPAVVSINVTGEVKTVSNTPEAFPGVPENSPFNEFFKRFRKGQPGGGQPRRPRLAQGSGFFISADGYAVTNNHVVNGAKKIKVTLDDKSTYPARIIGTDPRTDLALIKVDGRSNFPFVPFATTGARVGDWVLAVGNPFGLGGTVTAGIVSAHNRDIGSGPYDFLQIDAAVNRGNSGGPTFNLRGEVVGVNTAIFSPSGGNVGIAFAVPAALTTKVIEQLRNKGTVSRGWLGVHIQNVSDDIAESLGLDKARGALVTKITKDGPAENSELRIGDTILEVNGTDIASSRDLARKIAELSPRSVARMNVLRDGNEVPVNVTLGTFPGGKKLASIQKPKPLVPRSVKQLGMSLTAPKDASIKGVEISNVEATSAAAEKGISKGDIIREVGGMKVSSPKDVKDAIAKARARGRSAVLLRLESNGQPRFTALPLNKKG